MSGRIGRQCVEVLCHVTLATGKAEARTVKGRRPKAAAPSHALVTLASADRTNVGRLWALLALGHVELDLLVLVEVPVAVARDGACEETTSCLAFAPGALGLAPACRVHCC